MSQMIYITCLAVVSYIENTAALLRCHDTSTGLDGESQLLFCKTYYPYVPIYL